ncbi:MAG: ABC transporter ATP-binding protein, partial [Clostridium sp.]|nr:ABC transporter ATP-binding protein [Clostridium sp.]
MTGFDVAAMGRYPYTGRMGILSPEDRRITEESLELLEARDLAEVPFEEMSDGQKQRILLARAICQEPEVLVLDEPTSYLDIRYKIMLAKLLRKLAREKNMTVLLSLHEPEIVPYLADRVLCVKGDTIFRQGKPEEILTREGICELYGIPEKDYEESWLKFISDTGCGNGVY